MLIRIFFYRHWRLAALLSALLLFAASPGQWSIAPLMWIALVPLLLACSAPEISVKKAAGLGFICGLLYNATLLYWIVIALGRYGGLPLPVSTLAMLGLAAYMALYLAGFSAAITAMRRRLPLTLSAPIAWVGLDQLRAWLFTGFPWQDLGYSQFASPVLIQIADLTGHAGVTFIIVMTNALLTTLFCLGTKRNRGPGFSPHPITTTIALLLIIGSILYGLTALRREKAAIAQAPTIRVAVMQGNIDQNEKWSPENQEHTVQTYLKLTSQATKEQRLDLAIWPETALPFFPLANPLFTKVRKGIASPAFPEIITGAPHYLAHPAEPVNYYNSAFILTAEDTGAMQRYDKQHLVPFGEYVPLPKLLGVLPIAHTMGNFTAGNSSAPLVTKSAKIGTLICFESIFPTLARDQTASGAELLVNLTNDAWYGVSSAPYQQVSMAVLRAVENRRSLARAANTGISCFIDPTGQVLAASPIFKELFLTQELPIIRTQTWFTRLGYLFQPTCLLLLSLAGLCGIIEKFYVKRRLVSS